MYALCSIAALSWLLLARVLGPSDVWDHTQPKTISCTTDIIIHGGLRWLLPIERGEFPSTKPPLYNWMAVPFVKLLGFNSELAHKIPSVLAVCLCWLIVVRLGRKLDSHGDQSVGWIAGLILASTFTIFKLGYLARPDMLLTLWLLLAWISATAVLVRHAREGENQNTAYEPKYLWMVIAFWTCITLAGFTKGPAAIIGPLYALIAARLICGSWRSVRALHPAIGFTACLLVIGAWLYAVWQINPEHLRHELWYNEIFGRVTGLGPKGNHEGWRGWLIDLPEQLLYYLVRFVPWSLCSIAAMAVLWKRSNGKAGGCFGWQQIPGAAGAWLCGASIQVVIIVALFTLSSGKRADYISAAFGPGALLASWWLLRMRPGLGVKLPWLAPAVAALVLVAMTVVNQLQVLSPVKGYGDSIRSFIDQATEAISCEPLPMAYCWTGETHVQAMLGSSQIDSKEAVLALISQGRPFWLVAGRKTSAPHDFAQWLAKSRPNVQIEPVVRSAVLPRGEGWPEQMTLFRVAGNRTGEAQHPVQRKP